MAMRALGLAWLAGCVEAQSDATTQQCQAGLLCDPAPPALLRPVCARVRVCVRVCASARVCGGHLSQACVLRQGHIGPAQQHLLR